MKTFINQSRFIKAVEYVSEHLFSKPFSITPMVDRWFNQYAVVEIEYSTGLRRRVEVPFWDSMWPNYTDPDTGEVRPYDSMTYIDIILDGKPVSREDIKLVLKFKSPCEIQWYSEEKARSKKNIIELKTEILLEQRKLEKNEPPMDDTEKEELRAQIKYLQKEEENEAERLQELVESKERTAILRRIAELNDKKVQELGSVNKIFNASK